MRNPEQVLSSLQEHSTQPGYTYERLYRNLYNCDLFLQAYQNIYANKGNMTQGVDGKTIDAMSIERIERLIEALKDESYQPNPSRRTLYHFRRVFPLCRGNALACFAPTQA